MKNAMVQVRAQKKAGSKLLWNLPPSFMGDDYLTSMFFVVLRVCHKSMAHSFRFFSFFQIRN